MGSIGNEFEQLDDAFPSRIRTLIKQYEKNMDQEIQYNEEKTT